MHTEYAYMYLFVILHEYSFYFYIMNNINTFLMIKSLSICISTWHFSQRFPTTSGNSRPKFHIHCLFDIHQTMVILLDESEKLPKFPN